MQQIASLLIATALVLAGFAGGIYYERENSIPPFATPEESWTTPTYPPRGSYATPKADPEPGVGAEEAKRLLRETLGIEDPFERARRLAEVLGTLGAEDVDALRPVLEGRTLVELGSTEFELLTRFWSKHEPEEALQWARAESPAVFRLAALLPAMEEQARRDPAQALIVLNEINLIANPHGTAAQVALVHGWYDSGEPGLEAYIRNLGIGFERQRVMGVFARKAILRDGPTPLMEWARSLPPEDHKFKLTVYRQIGSELAKLYPEAATAWCDAVCDGPFGTSVRSLVAQRWARQDGPAAMHWLSTAPAGQERDWAVQGAQRGFWRTDPQGFEAWVDEHTQGGENIEPWLAPALQMFAIGMANKLGRIPDALRWAERIPDQEGRWRAFVSIARIWRVQDERAADAWIDQSPLDEEGRTAARQLGTPNPYTDAGKAAKEKAAEEAAQTETGEEAS